MKPAAGDTGPPESLANLLQALCRERGALGFDEFMELALYHPELGYYGAGAARVGTAGGDFFTNVSVGSIYGEILAGQIVETWQQLGQPGQFHLFEQGAHDGQLMADVLTELQKHPALFSSLRVFLVEENSRWHQAQKQTLSPWSGLVYWISPHQPPAPAAGFFFANELLDAFPFALAEFHGNGWQERCVTLETNGNFAWVSRTPAPWLAPRLLDLPRPATGPFLIEIPRALPEWTGNTSRLLKSGVLLLCDYGFLENELFSRPRPEGTYQCYRQHQRDEDPLATPGEKDITAHVNFSATQRALAGAGWDVRGFLDQHHFLVGAATPWLKKIEQAGVGPADQKKLRQLQTLLHPETMGAQFKFLVAGRGLPASFSLSGLSHIP